MVDDLGFKAPVGPDPEGFDIRSILVTSKYLK